MAAFGQAADGSEVQRYVIARDGLRACLISQGAVLQDLRLAGHAGPLVLGYPDLEPYLENPAYFGAIVGRYANRIRDGVAMIDGREYQLDRNTPQGHLLHGGAAGTAAKNWMVSDTSATHVSFETSLAAGDMGFPGRLGVQVTYRLLPAQTMEVEITARTDAPTLCSFAHHSYFNLGNAPTITGHRLTVDADAYLPVDEDTLPTGEVAAVADTDMDFRAGVTLDDHSSFDHNLCLAPERRALTPVARLEAAGVSLSLATTEPGLQVYTADGIAPGGDVGLGGVAYGPRAGIALEPQLWPDAVNHPRFPSALLRAGETYRQVSRYSFSKGGDATKSENG